MAAEWKDWDDEEWLKAQDPTTLYNIYSTSLPDNADEDTRKLADSVKAKIKTLMSAQMREAAKTGFENTPAADVLAYTQLADGDTMNAEITDSEGKKHTVMDILEYATRTRYEALADEDSLSGLLAGRALLMANLKANEAIYENSIERVAESEDFQQKANDASQAMKDCDTKLAENKTNLESKLTEDREFSDVEFAHYDAAEEAGALEGISEEAKNAFIDTLARHSGWDKINGTEVVFNDNALASMGVNGLEPYGKDGKLNPVYEQCAELLGKIQFEVPADAKAEDIQSYKQQLLSNAAMRATNEILKDKSFKLRYKTAEEMLDAYKQEVAGQFERGVLLTCLAGHKETATMLENITYNKETQKIESKEGKDGIKNALEDILTGKAKINPAAIAVDTEMLNLENKKISKILKRKRIDENKLTFLQKAKKVFHASWDNIIKKGGYQKILANFAVFGASALLISNPATAAVITGAAMYAGWTAVNAWVVPVYDKLNQEMREKGVKGFKNKWKYLTNNWKRAKAEKYAEPDFKKRAWHRATEGLIVGGISGGLAGGAADAMRTFARQGTMAVGKSTSRIMSLFSRKNATTKFLENPTLGNLNALNTARANEKSDTIALASVVFGAAAADYLALTETGQEITAAVKEIKIFNREATGIGVKEATTDTPGQTLDNVVEERQSTADSTLNNVVEEQQPTADSTLNNVVEEQQTTADATRRPAMVDKDGDGIPDYIQRPADQMDDLPSDSTAAATQNVDTTGAGEVPDTTGAGETAAGESGTEVPAGDGTPAQTAPQPGDILSKEDFGYGVTKTVTMGEKYNYIQYDGLPEGTLQTPDDFQDFLERRIHNMNQYNELVTVVDGAGNAVPLDQATNVMLQRLTNGELTIPEGMTPEHALYVAYMKAHYYGDTSLLDTIACPDGAEAGAIHKQLALDSRLFNTAKIPGVPYGVPTDGMKLIDNSGTVNVEVCAPEVKHVEEVSRPETVELKDQARAGSQPEEVPEYTGKQQTPQTVLTATYAGQKQDVPFDINRLTKDAQPEVININKDGNMVLWAKGEMTLPTGEAISRFEVETPVYLNPDLSNATLSNIVTKGAVRSYIFGEGNNALTVGIDKSGHAKVFFGQDEINLGSESARQVNDLIAAANERFGLTEADYTLGAGENQDNVFLNALDPEQKARAEELIARKTNRMEQDLEKAFNKAKEHPVELDEATKRTAMQNRLENLAAEAEATDPEAAAAPAAAEQSTESFIGGDGTVIIDMKDPAITENLEHFKEQGVSDETLAVNLAVKEREYQLLQEKAANGEALNNVEQRQIAEYEKLLQEQKLTHVGESKAPDVPETTEKSQETSEKSQETTDKSQETTAEKTVEQTEKPDEKAQTSIRASINQTMKEFTDVQNHYQQALEISMNDRGQYTLNGVVQGSRDVAVSEQQTLPSFLAREELFARQMDTKLEKGISLSEAETKRLSTYDQYLKRYNLDRAPAEEGGSGRNQENNLEKPEHKADINALRGLAQDGKSAGAPKSQNLSSNTVSAGMSRNLNNKGR